MFQKKKNVIVYMKLFEMFKERFSYNLGAIEHIDMSCFMFRFFVLKVIYLLMFHNLNRVQKACISVENV